MPAHSTGNPPSPGHPHGSGRAGTPSLCQAAKQDASFTGRQIPTGETYGLLYCKWAFQQFDVPSRLLLLVTVLSSLLVIAKPEIEGWIWMEARAEDQWPIKTMDFHRHVEFMVNCNFPAGPALLQGINDFSIPQGLRFNSLWAFSTPRCLLSLSLAGLTNSDTQELVRTIFSHLYLAGILDDRKSPKSLSPDFVTSYALKQSCSRVTGKSAFHFPFKFVIKLSQYNFSDTSCYLEGLCFYILGSCNFLL